MSRFTLSCQCGNVLNIPDANPGQEVRCANCGRLSIVKTQADSAPAQAKAENWIKFTCPCGKSVKAPVNWGGKVAKCPRCGRKTRLPGGDPNGLKDDPMSVFYDPKEADRDIVRLSQLDDHKQISPSGKSSILPSPVEPTSIGRSSKDHPSSMKGEQLDSASPNHLGNNPSEGTICMEAVTERDGDDSHPPDSKETLDRVHSKVAVEADENRVAKADATSDSHDSLEGFLRTNCSCGKVVKAPLSSAGKIGRCPKCGNDVVMPLVPAKKSGQAVPDDSHEIEPLNRPSGTVRAPIEIAAAPDPNQAPSSDHRLADPTHVKSMTEPPPAKTDSIPIETDEAKTSAQLNASSASSQTGVSLDKARGGESDSPDPAIRKPDLVNKQIEIKRRTALYARFRRREQISLNDILWTLVALPKTLLQSGSNMPPVIAAGISVVALAMAIAIFIFSMPNDYVEAQKTNPVPRDYYFDMSTGQLLELTTVEYATRADQAARVDPNKEYTVVRAYVYGCGSCDPATRQIVFLERVTADAVRAQYEYQTLTQKGERGNQQTAALAKIMDSGDLIARFTAPTPDKSKPNSKSAAIVSAASTTAPAASQPSGLNVSTSTSQPSSNSSARELIDRLKWVPLENAESIMRTPLLDCMKNTFHCSPEPK